MTLKLGGEALWSRLSPIQNGHYGFIEQWLDQVDPRRSFVPLCLVKNLLFFFESM
jgi:hypothetical protein